jgi:ribosomal-protein-alanine N-acetyltransferase
VPEKMISPGNPFPELVTTRLKLQEIRDEDAARLHAIWTDSLVTRYLVLDPFTEIQQTREMIGILKALYPSGEGLRWALSIPAGQEVIGTCGFHNWKKEHARAEIGYEMDPRYWGQGLMSEAVIAMLGYGFTEMGLNRVEAFVTVGNRKSLSFLEGNGFTREGTLRQYEWARGCYQDQWICSLLKQDWDNRKRP